MHVCLLPRSHCKWCFLAVSSEITKAKVVLHFKEDASKSSWRLVARRRLLHCLCSIYSMFKSRKRKMRILNWKHPPLMHVSVRCHQVYEKAELKKKKKGRERELQPRVTCGDLFFVSAFSQGAFWGLVVGLAIGLVRMIIEFIYSAPSCGEEDRRPAVLKDLHYLYFALILCVLTAIVIVLVSLCTPPIPEEKVSDFSQKPRLVSKNLWNLSFSFPSMAEKWSVKHTLQRSTCSSAFCSPGLIVLMLPKALSAWNWVRVSMLCLELGRHHSPS